MSDTSEYPNAVDVFPQELPSVMQGPPKASDLIPKAFRAIEAVQAELGTLAKGAFTSVKARIAAIEANSWVTNARIAAGAVTNSKVADVSWTKVTPTNGYYYWEGHVYSTGHIRADGNVQAIDYVQAGPGTFDGAYPGFRLQRYHGVLSSAGLGQVGHAISSAQLRVAFAQFGYEGGAGEWRPCKVTQINGNDIYFAADGGTGAPSPASKPFSGFVIYTQDITPW